MVVSKIRWWLTYIILACSATVVQGQILSNQNIVGILPLTNARCQAADFNNDGILDLFVSGTTNTGALQTRVYYHNGNFTFNVFDFPALADLDFALADYNADGYVDVLMQGVDVALNKHTRIFRNNTGTGFVMEPFPLTPLSKGGVLWYDFDHDTDVDIILTGLDSELIERALVYEWRDGTYALKSANILPVSNGRLIATDIDDDGWFELLLTGLNANGDAVTQWHGVSDALEFIPVPSAIEGIAFNALAVSDVNADGRMDLIAAGLAGTDLEIRTRVVTNSGNNAFVQVATGMQDVSFASVATADLDHNGTADVVLNGHDENGFNYSQLYINNGAAVFSLLSETMTQVYMGQSTLGDFDNDGDLDVFSVGNSDITFQARMYRSNVSITISNDAPSVPTGLNAETNDDEVTLSWQASQDDHTATASITYNLLVSANEEGTQIVMAAHANLVDGVLRIPAHGNNGTARSRVLHHLPEGEYFWTVQAIDNSFRASEFAAMQSFSICYPVSLGDDRHICMGDETQLTTGSPLDLVDWYSKSTGLISSGQRTLTRTISLNDTLVAVVTKPFGCAVRDTVVAHAVALPVPTLGNDRDVCHGELVSLNTGAAIDSVNWYRKNDSQLLLQNALQYEYRVTDRDTIVAQAYNFPYRCVNYDTVVVRMLSLPQVSLGSDRSVCNGQPTSFAVADNSLILHWRTRQSLLTAAATNEFAFTVSETDTVIVEAIDANQCRGYDSARIVMLDLPDIHLPADTAVCFGSDLLLEYHNDGVVFEWRNRNDEVIAFGVDHYLHHVDTKDTITARVVDASGCVNNDDIIVDVLPLPVFSLGRDTAICHREHILLQAGFGFQRVDWFSKRTGQSIKDDSWFFNYTVLQTDTVIARVTSMQGCVNRDSIRVERLALPAFSLGNDFAICDKQNVSLSVPGNWHEVHWSTQQGNVVLGAGVSLDFQPQESMSVVARVTSIDQCVNRDTVMIAVRQLPVFDLGLDRHACAGDQVLVEPGVFATFFEWHDNAGSVIPSVNRYAFQASQSKRIRLKVTDANGCVYQDSLFVEVDPLPAVTVVGDKGICSGSPGTYSIVSDGFQSIAWKTSAQLPLGKNVLSIVYALPSSTRVIATLKDLKGCVNSDSLDVEVFPLPTANAGRDTLICFGMFTRLGTDASANLSFEWTPDLFLDDKSLARPLATPLSSVEYTLKVTSQHGCVSHDTVFVDVNPQVTVDAGTDAAVCIGNSITLGGTPTASGSKFPYTFQWISADGTFSSVDANPQVTPTTATTYYVFATTGRCEVFVDSIHVVVNPRPMLTLPAKYTVGAGAGVQLNVSGAATYQWRPASALNAVDIPDPIASPQVTTVYAVTGTDENGCTTEVSTTVLVQNVLFVPTLFTPNNDGSNDRFMLYGSGVTEISLTIYDKEGGELYRTGNVDDAFSQGWDGTRNGQTLPDDLYVWAIEGKYANGEPVLFEGRARGFVKLMK